MTQLLQRAVPADSPTWHKLSNLVKPEHEDEHWQETLFCGSLECCSAWRSPPRLCAAGAAAGNGNFNQLGAVSTETQGQLGRVGTLSTSLLQGQVNNTAATGALAGAATASQQVSQAGNLLNGGRGVGAQGTNLNLATTGAVNTQTGAVGQGAFGGTNTVQTLAELVGRLPALGPGGTFQGVGAPALGNLRTTPPPPPMPMMRRRGGHRDWGMKRSRTPGYIQFVG